MDCTKLSDDKFSLADLEDQTGDWQRVGAYSSWLSARIFEETQPGKGRVPKDCGSFIRI